MKTGEVAVENSVNAFRAIKSGKLKDRAAAPHYAGHPVYQQHQQLAQFQQHLYAPLSIQYQPQPLAGLHPYLPVQPLSMYQRYSSGSALTASGYGASRPVPGTPYQQHYQPQNGGVKRSMRPIQPPLPAPPASLPVQVQASLAMGVSHSKVKVPACARFTSRGNCAYGSSCKFLHDNKTSNQPLSAPPTKQNKNQSQIWPMASTRSKNPVEPSNSLDESDFPSLSADSTQSGGNSIGNQSPHRDMSPPPSRELGFRDAVLNQHTRRGGGSKQAWSSPSKSSTSSDGESSVSTEDEQHVSASTNQDSSPDQTPHRTQHRANRSSIGRTSKDGDDSDDLAEPASRHARYRARPSHTSLDHHGSSPRPVRPQPMPSTYQSVHVMDGASGKPGYVLLPVYNSNQAFGSDDSGAFSVLSRDANAFVLRLDSSLRSLVGHQQRAIAKLEEIAKCLWADSTIGIYGSNFTRLALPQSDVDCVITAPSLAAEPPADILRKLAGELRSQHWTRRVELLDGAKIPVLKIVYRPSKSRSEVMLDLTCAHSPGHSGLSARSVIYAYQVEMPALRPLVLILKSHIQRRGLNSAFTGGLSSYGLVLLVIRFLQACGDEHQVGDGTLEPDRENCHGRSMSDSSSASQCRPSVDPRGPLVYDFKRDGKITWRTGLGNLLLLFLETYVTFDYRRFGITIENMGDYFPLPADKVSLEPGAVIAPYIVDPIKTNRNIGNCFRMHEVIQAWYELYLQLTSGVSVEDAINQPSQPYRPV